MILLLLFLVIFGVVLVISGNNTNDKSRMVTGFVLLLVYAALFLYLGVLW